MKGGRLLVSLRALASTGAGGRARVLGLLGSLGGMALTTGCRSTARAETASLLAAVERFQTAENRDRPARAREVAAVPCTAPEVSPACTACVGATGVTGRALELKGEVEAALAQAQDGRLMPLELQGLRLDDKLVEAMRLLDQGREGMGTCERELARARSAVGL